MRRLVNSSISLAKPTPKKELRGFPVTSHPKSLKLPKEFDARKAWPQCTTIGRILANLYFIFQGHCGSCWAFGAVESLSDRFCIHFGMNLSLSVNDLLACCGFLCGDGCNGGYPIYAWRYFVNHGVVTEECDPYFDDIGCSHPGCTPEFPTPKCVRKCVDKNQLWSQSKHYGVNAYRISSDPQDIMAEVLTNGPVEVAFIVYELSLLGGGLLMMERIIGFLQTSGIEAGVDGYFKILRGTNECGIEEDVIAGLPSARNLDLVREVTGTDAVGDEIVVPQVL
ncbi:hypothetical protein GH714_021948 [Hevea brasiliensis]|uniref:Peptidase C1A papain C-terminal domain-containing protein n=1 Tax=Hevea brasiliensis TaxID=3981 RepID=A0A6A6NIC7_HEVBR|nr:hypothetical protein GH714_021948 [Hevea brasiliensis]